MISGAYPAACRSGQPSEPEERACRRAKPWPGVEVASRYEILQSVDPCLQATLLHWHGSISNLTSLSHEGTVRDRKGLVMPQPLYQRVFSTQILVRVAFATVSLYFLGTALAQGVPAGALLSVQGPPDSRSRSIP